MHFFQILTNNPDKKHELSHFLSQPIRAHLHPAKGKPFLAQVLQRDSCRLCGLSHIGHIKIMLIIN